MYTLNLIKYCIIELDALNLMKFIPLYIVNYNELYTLNLFKYCIIEFVFELDFYIMYALNLRKNIHCIHVKLVH